MSLARDSVASVGPREVVTTSGARYPADFIVRHKHPPWYELRLMQSQILATGFEFSQWQGDRVTGRGGVTLQKHWNRVGGTAAYKTITVNQFPNFFYILGPNSGSGHTSVLYSMEWLVDPNPRKSRADNTSSGVDLIIRLAGPVLKRMSKTVEVDADAETQWCNDVQDALGRTVLAGSCANVGFFYPAAVYSLTLL